MTVIKFKMVKFKWLILPQDKWPSLKTPVSCTWYKIENPCVLYVIYHDLLRRRRYSCLRSIFWDFQTQLIESSNTKSGASRTTNYFWWKLKSCAGLSSEPMFVNERTNQNWVLADFGDDWCVVELESMWRRSLYPGRLFKLDVWWNIGSVTRYRLGL